MRTIVMAVGVGVMVGFGAVGAALAAEPLTVGQNASSVSFTDTTGATHTIGEFQGNFVVLEWFNPECPFVQKHYNSHNMQTLQREFAERGVIWVSVNSGATGQQGHMTTEQAEVWMESQGASPAHIVLDVEGALGHTFGARTTPHMFLINPEGTVIYAGAIDSIRSVDPDDVPKATNYVRAALASAMNGQPVAEPTTRPYGCSVKY